MELLENETGKRFESSSVLLVHSTWFVLAQKGNMGQQQLCLGVFNTTISFFLNRLSVLVHMQVCADVIFMRAKVKEKMQTNRFDGIVYYRKSQSSLMVIEII